LNFPTLQAQGAFSVPPISIHHQKKTMGACQSQLESSVVGFEGPTSTAVTKPTSNKHPLSIFIPHQLGKKTHLPSPSEATQHTAPITPSSLLPSPFNDIEWNGISPLASLPENGDYDASSDPDTSAVDAPSDLSATVTTRKGDQDNVKILHQRVTSADSIVVRPVLMEKTNEMESVTPQMIATFQKLKLQAQIAERAFKQRKRKEKVADRYEQVKEYRTLWKEYKEIQEQVINNSQDDANVSFLKQPETWYIDFNTVHNQQQQHKQEDSPDRDNLSLLSEEIMEAQRKFFKEKSNERKQGTTITTTTTTTTSPLRGAGGEDLPVQSANSKVSFVRGQTEANGYGPIRAQTMMEGVVINAPHQEEEQEQATIHSPSPHLLSMDAVSKPILEMSSADKGVVRWRQFDNKKTDDSVRRLNFAGGEPVAKPTSTSTTTGSTTTSTSTTTTVFKTPTAAQTVNPFWDMSSEHFLMMSSPSFDPSSMEQKEEEQQQARPTSSNPFRDMSSEQFMMMSSPPGTLSYQSEDEDETRPREEKEKSAPMEKVLDPSIDFMATKDYGPIFTSSPSKSEKSYDDTISSSPKVFNRSTARSPQASASTEEEESSEADDELYVWDGHMDDEDFWDIDRGRLSLDQCDELASQVSTQISSLLSRFREDNNSLHTRSINP
jgi:hypothetical protein